MNSKIFILKISDIIELGCRFLVQYICREMLINAYARLCPYARMPVARLPSVPVCIKIVDGRARCGLGAVCAVPFSNTSYPGLADKKDQAFLFFILFCIFSLAAGPVCPLITDGKFSTT